jgi:hypothetical protein
MSLIQTETTITFKIPAEFPLEALADTICGHDKIETDNGNTIITFLNAEYKQIHYGKILELVEYMRIHNPEIKLYNRLKSDIVQAIRNCERY